jgi:hypothetical protein
MTQARGGSKRRNQIAQYVDTFPERHRQGRDDATVAELVRDNAYHQAGHVVVCCLLYGARVIKSATILPDDEKLGEVVRFSALPIPLTCRPSPEERRGPIPPDALVDAEGVFAYAGMAAEDLLATQGGRDVAQASGAEDRARPPARGSDDRHGLAKLASSLGRERPVDRFFEAYWEEARRLLRQNWDSVERVVAALLEHGRLSGDRIDRLVF